jgi:hypothetical protein
MAVVVTVASPTAWTVKVVEPFGVVGFVVVIASKDVAVAGSAVVGFGVKVLVVPAGSAVVILKVMFCAPPPCAV